MLNPEEIATKTRLDKLLVEKGIDLKEKPNTIYADDHARISVKVHRLLKGMASELPAEETTATIRFSEEYDRLGCSVVLSAGTCWGTPIQGAFVVTNRSTSALELLGIPYIKA